MGEPQGATDRQRPDLFWREASQDSIPWVGFDMTETRQPKPDYYRGKAEEIRRFAARASTTEARLELFEIAAAFQRLADWVESQSATAAD